MLVHQREAKVGSIDGARDGVDLTVGNWRDIPFVKEAVSASGMQVIVATGIYWEVPYYFKAQSGVDHRQGGARSPDGGARRALPGVWLRLAQRLLHA